VGEKKILDLGCGKYKVPGAIGIDWIDLPGVDIVHDLNVFPYPLGDGEFDEIHCYHVLEHVEDVIGVMREIYRVAKPQARIFIRVPHASCSKSLWMDPTHKRGFTTRSFIDYFSEDAEFGYYSHVDLRLDTLRMNYCYDRERGTRKIPAFFQSFCNHLANLNLLTQELWERVIAGYVGGFEELYVELTVIKDPH